MDVLQAAKFGSSSASPLVRFFGKPIWITPLKNFLSKLEDIVQEPVRMTYSFIHLRPRYLLLNLKIVTRTRPVSRKVVSSTKFAALVVLDKECAVGSQISCLKAML